MYVDRATLGPVPIADAAGRARPDDRPLPNAPADLQPTPEAPTPTPIALPAPQPRLRPGPQPPRTDPRRFRLPYLRLLLTPSPRTFSPSPASVSDAGSLLLYSLMRRREP